MEVLKVSAKTEANKLAGSIAEAMRRESVVKVRAIGAGALNQAVKGVAIARGFLAPQGVDICVVPGFVSVDVHNEKRTGIALEVRRL